MAFQGEREPGVEMDLEMVESMAQDEIPVQDIPIEMQVEFPPQTDPEPEMGAAAAEAAVYDTSPPLLRQNPPILAESAQPSAPDMAQLCAMLAGVNATMQQMQSEMKTNAQQMKEEIKNKMETSTYEIKTMRAG